MQVFVVIRTNPDTGERCFIGVGANRRVAATIIADDQEEYEQIFTDEDYSVIEATMRT